MLDLDQFKDSAYDKPFAVVFIHRMLYIIQAWFFISPAGAGSQSLYRSDYVATV